MTRRISFQGMVALGAAALLIALFGVVSGRTSAGQSSKSGIKIHNDDIGGTVTSAKGPEAGVWVIAETTDLPTRYIKEVVTDDRGRYLIPDLPKAKYTVWARGYGLVDSPKVESRAGQAGGSETDLWRRMRKAAAQYYPANYWYSLLEVPGEKEFPGTGPAGNGISPDVKEPGPVDSSDQDRQLRVLPSTRQQIHADDSGDVQQSRSRAGVDAPRPIGAGWRGHDGRPGSTRHASEPPNCSAIGPRASRRANCPRRRRRGRRESSATS